MTLPAITVDSVSKQYHLGTGYGAEATLGQKLERILRKPFRRGEDDEEEHASEFWALRDVSFEVEPGIVLGMIGANGAGKSTMLKMLGNITLPTEGRIHLRGRVGTLLEVGTGFHPELSGRENIWLNGAILGMTRKEIADAFDDIVEFSGIGKFLDTPVKRYSSGMHIRLGFSVAAHLKSEILLVDEVLAVGDTEFQRKCMGRMDEIAYEGRTVVFVSHSMAAVQRMTERCIWLDHGRIVEDGDTGHVIANYLQEMGPSQGHGEAAVADGAHRIGTGDAKLVHAALLNGAGEKTDRITMGEPVTVVATIDVHKPVVEGIAEIGLAGADGTRVATALSSDDGTPPLQLEPGRHEIRAELNATMLPGEFWIDIGLHDFDRAVIDHVERVLTFSCLNTGFEETETWPWHSTNGRGYLRLGSRWASRESDAELPAVEIERGSDPAGLDEALSVGGSDPAAAAEPNVESRRGP